MGEEPSPRNPSQWYKTLLHNVKSFDEMYRAVGKNGSRITASKFQIMDTIAMVIIEARDHIIANDGIKSEVENSVQWVSLKMMILKQILISLEDPSKQLN